MSHNTPCRCSQSPRPSIGVVHVWRIHSGEGRRLQPATGFGHSQLWFWLAPSAELEPVSWLCSSLHRLGSTRPFEATTGPSIRTVTTLSHLTGITSSLARVSWDDGGRAPGIHGDTSRPCCSTWSRKSADASSARGPQIANPWTMISFWVALILFSVRGDFLWNETQFTLHEANTDTFMPCCVQWAVPV
jgi:hypothetical protein